MHDKIPQDGRTGNILVWGPYTAQEAVYYSKVDCYYFKRSIMDQLLKTILKNFKRSKNKLIVEMKCNHKKYSIQKQVEKNRKGKWS